MRKRLNHTNNSCCLTRASGSKICFCRPRGSICSCCVSSWMFRTNKEQSPGSGRRKETKLSQLRSAGSCGQHSKTVKLSLLTDRELWRVDLLIIPGHTYLHRLSCPVFKMERCDIKAGLAPSMGCAIMMACDIADPPMIAEVSPPGKTICFIIPSEISY